MFTHIFSLAILIPMALCLSAVIALYAQNKRQLMMEDALAELIHENEKLRYERDILFFDDHRRIAKLTHASDEEIAQVLADMAQPRPKEAAAARL